MKKFNFDLRALIHSNRFLQIISVIIGVLCWCYVVTVIYPDTEGEFQLKVDLANQQEEIDRLGLNIIGEASQNVTVKVRGQRYLLAQLEPEDLNITASLEKVDGPGSYSLSLSGENDGIEYLSISPNTLDVKFDVFSTKTLPVETDLEGLTIPEGYLVQDQSVSPKSITVSGPDEDLSRVERCVFSSTFNKPLQRTTTVEGQVTLLDKNGDEVVSDHISLSSEEVTLTIPVLKIKELPFTIKFINLPPSMSEEDLTYNLSSSTLEIAGPVDQVDRYSELVLGYVDMKELTPDGVYVFEVQDALPADFVNVQNVENVVVDFVMDDVGYRYINVDNFQLLNTSAEYDITVRTERLSNVLIYARQDILDELVPGDLVAEIDMSTREIIPGQFSIGVTIYAPNKELLWVSGDYSVIIHVTEKNSGNASVGS